MAKRIFIPRSVFVASAVAVGLVNLVLATVPMLLLLLVMRFPLHATWIFLPVGVLLLSLFSAGVSLVLFTIASRFSDVREMYLVFVQTWFFLTPIVYHPSIIPARFRLVLWLNPMYYLIQTFRRPIYDGLLPEPKFLVPSIAISLAALLCGWIYFCCHADGEPMREDPVIRLESVTLRYRIPRERIRSFKEYTIRRIKRLVVFDEIEALRDFDLSVEPGETLGVIGRNGAGKSTLFKVIARVLYPTEGRVVVAGRIAPLLELGLGFHGELTGRENVQLQGALLGFSRKEMRRRLAGIVAWSELADFIDSPSDLLLRQTARWRLPYDRRGAHPARGRDPGRRRRALPGKMSRSHRRVPAGGKTVLQSRTTCARSGNCRRVIWIHRGIRTAKPGRHRRRRPGP
jgi:hypothetical protein